MHADIFYIREYGHVYPFCCGQINGLSDIDRSEQALYKQDTIVQHQTPSQDNSEDIHR